MELASRAFDSAVRNTRRVSPHILNAVGWNESGAIDRARQLVRLGGLLHDVGHSPFSHGPEDLFAKGIAHEDMTASIIRDSELATELKRISHLGHDAEDVIAVALGPKFKGEPRHQQARMLSHPVTGAVGVDRIDYLLRDSYYTGVGYGQFDVDPILSTLRISEIDGEPFWAVELGGELNAEQLLLARWFMHMQVYHHKTRGIMDLHLIVASETRTIISTVSALAGSDSKTTRAHIQKLLFFAQSWGLRKSPRFDFVMYLHWPYSFELDKKLFEMECLGDITRKPAPDGYGSHYSVARPQYDGSLTVLAEWLGPMSVRELESRATCQFFIDRRAEDPVAAVLEVKPHLQTDEIEAACSDVLKMRKKITA